MPDIQQVVVVGGNAGGMTAASAIVRGTDGAHRVVAFERGRHTSYSNCGIPYFIGGIADSLDSLVARRPEQHRARGIDVRTGHEVLAVDTAARRVQVRDPEGKVKTEPYDQLVLAPGAKPLAPDLPGIDSAGVHGVTDLESAIAIRHAAETSRSRRAVVVGGGYIGLEMAEALLRRGLDVSLVERGPEVMSTLDPDMGGRVSEALRRLGVHLYLNESVQEFENEHGHVRAVRTDRRVLEADLVVLGLGVRPNTDLAQRAGIPLGPTGAIAVNPRQQTRVEGVWAAGDCAESWHLVSRQPVNIALGTVANKQGLVAGINLAGGYATFPGVVGTAVSQICAYEVARTGLRESDIAPLGLECRSAIVKSKTRASYFPGPEDIWVKLVAERGTGRLLGAQIVGREGAAKRIDVLACALHANWTVHDVVNLDLSYAPPYSGVWDPVQQAARVLARELA